MIGCRSSTLLVFSGGVIEPENPRSLAAAADSEAAGAISHQRRAKSLTVWAGWSPAESAQSEQVVAGT